MLPRKYGPTIIRYCPALDYAVWLLHQKNYRIPPFTREGEDPPFNPDSWRLWVEQILLRSLLTDPFYRKRSNALRRSDFKQRTLRIVQLLSEQNKNTDWDGDVDRWCTEQQAYYQQIEVQLRQGLTSPEFLNNRIISRLILKFPYLWKFPFKQEPQWRRYWNEVGEKRKKE